MAKIKFECDANNIGLKMIEEFVEFAANKQVTCKYETRKLVIAKIESGAATSERDAERQVAEETGEKENTVHKRNQRAKKQAVGTKPENVPTAVCTVDGCENPRVSKKTRCSNCDKAKRKQERKKKAAAVNIKKNTKWFEPVIASFSIEFRYRQLLEKHRTEKGILIEMNQESGIPIKVLKQWIPGEN
jgi:hypothetical protein